jgi:hypothetical protein
MPRKNSVPEVKVIMTNLKVSVVKQDYETKATDDGQYNAHLCHL